MDNIKSQKPCHFFFQNKNETQNFTINKPNLIKKSKYQQYFHCFIVCIRGPFAFQFSFQQNIVTILISAVFRGVALITGRHLFQCGYPKVRRLSDGGTYLRPGAYQRKYGNICIIHLHLTEAYLKVGNAMFYFCHSKSSPNIMKNIFDSKILC